MSFKKMGIFSLLALSALLLVAPNHVKRAISVAVISKDALSGAVPVVVYEGELDSVWENGFETSIVVSCNRFVDRMISVWFDPNIEPDQIQDKSIAGKSIISLYQDGYSFSGEYSLDRYGMEPIGSWGRERWSIRGKYIGEYPVIGGLFCTDQRIHVRVEDLNFDPRNHAIKIIVNRYFLH